MQYLLDIAGSVITGSIVLLMLIGVNSRINQHSADILITSNTTTNTIAAGNIIEFDFYKLGYLADTSLFIITEESKCKFRAEIDIDLPNPEEITYFIGSTEEISGTPNPNDKPLYRQINEQDPELIAVVTEFKVTYLDSVQKPIDYYLLTVQQHRDRIRAAKFYMKVESAELIEDYYPFIEWAKIIVPKNLKAQG